MSIRLLNEYFQRFFLLTILQSFIITCTLILYNVPGPYFLFFLFAQKTGIIVLWLELG